METLQKIDKILLKILWAIVIICFVVLMILITGQVASRFFRMRILAPPDEIVKLVFVWFGYLGATIVLREHSHLRIELFDEVINKTQKRQGLYELVIGVLQLTFFIFLMQSSWQLFVTSKTRTSPMLSWPQQIWYSPLVLSTFFMIIYSLREILYGLFKIRGRDQ